MALTAEDLYVIGQFLQRAPCHGAGEAKALIHVLELVEATIKELQDPPSE